jgi:hypothetical protein
MDWSDLVETNLPVIIAAATGIWALLQFLEHRKEIARQDRVEAEKDSRTRQIESRKPFLELQLKLYVETAQISGKLASLDVTSKEWKEAAIRFWALYWSELCMVESQKVEDAMVKLGDAVQACQDSGDNELRVDVKNHSIDLAHILRKEIETAWTSDPARAAQAASAGTP